VLGYITAALGSLFVARDAADRHGEVAGADALHDLRAEIWAPRTEVHAFSERA
jgi:hypothetical protein